VVTHPGASTFGQYVRLEGFRRLSVLPHPTKPHNKILYPIGYFISALL